jgi:uncharacterized protein
MRSGCWCRQLLGFGVAAWLVGAAPANRTDVVDMARTENWEALKELLEEGANARTTENDGTTALHWASHWDHVESAELLIRAGADVNAVTDLGVSALWPASLNGSSAMVSVLLEAGADPNLALLSGETPLMAAARSGSAAVVGQLLSKGADVNVSATRGQTALMWAVANKHPGVVRVLLANAVDIHARSDTWVQMMGVPLHTVHQRPFPRGGSTPVMFAAAAGDLASARLLLAGGANVNDTDAWGMSATALAAHAGHKDLVALFLESGADPDAADAGFAALHVAILRGDVEMVRTLISHGADLNIPVTSWTPAVRDSQRYFNFGPELVGATPFWLAARFAQPEVMRLLAEGGADPLFVHQAEYYRRGEGSEIDGVDDQGVLVEEAATALMAVVGMVMGDGGTSRPRPRTPAQEREETTLAAVKLAIELGIDVNAVDEKGRTALSAARGLGYPSVVEFLIANGAR